MPEAQSCLSRLCFCGGSDNADKVGNETKPILNATLKHPYPMEFHASRIHSKLDTLFARLSKKAVRVKRKDDAEYRGHAYQYSTTSHKSGTMNPAAIIYPKDENDIVEIVKFAAENKVSVAVRTGGHQYSGASSCSGDNIQVDLSNTFNEFEYDADTGLLFCGISLSLLTFNTKLRERGMFMPHGQCAHVHVGGHCQTGGYGQLGRAHGLFCDHVEACSIVTASGQIQKVVRPVKGQTDQDNDDLFWAIFGGSPGNLGILTHLWIRPLHDKDYPKSCGMKLFSLYSKEKLDKCLQIMAEMSDNADFPRDIDYCCTVMSDEMESWYFKHHFLGVKEPENVDQEQFFNHPADYGDGVPEIIKGIKHKSPTPQGIILLYVQWANTGGADQEFGEFERSYFESLRKALEPNFFDAALHVKLGLDHLGHDLRRLFGKEKKSEQDEDAEDFVNTLDYRKHVPMSDLTRYWVYPDIREYVKPYEKRTYMTDRTDLSTNGWAKWVANRVNMLAGHPGQDLKVIIQIQPFGGKNSMYRKCSEDGSTSHSWRDVTTISQVIDCFYNPKPGVAKLANDWQAGNDEEAGGPNGVFCTKDRRVLWGSYGRKSDPGGGASLDAVWDKYYDSREKYDRLVRIKRRVDPDHILSANAFGIDASSKPLIKSIDH